MRHLHIENIGPLCTVDVQLRKINLIIAPQSAGKSCILKIASFCAWLEKKIELNRAPEAYLKRSFMDECLIAYHNMKGYVHEDSLFSYETDTMMFSFDFKDNSSVFKWKDGKWKYRRSKIVYIVAERNILSVVPNWYGMKFPENSIRDFLEDWQNARNNIKGNVTMPILNIGVGYHYDNQSGMDKIVLEDKQELTIQNASSGLQSIVPLYVLIDYMTNGFFETEMRSVNDYDISLRLFEHLKNEHPSGKYVDFDGSSISLGSEDLIKVVHGLTEYNHSDIYLEEPEENLFPETQYDLVNWMSEQLHKEREHSLFIATHSPYIMSAFNNLIQAGDIIEESPEKRVDVERIIGGKRAIFYDEVAAFAITDGVVHSIKDDELKLISPSELDTASDNISNVFNQLLQL